MRSLTKRYGLFVDSDKRSEVDCLPDDRQRWKEECEADGAIVHFTRKREIENYLHPDVVNRILGKTVTIDDFSDIKNQLGPRCCGLVKHMTVEEILERDRWEDTDGNEHHELAEIISEFLTLAQEL